MKQRALDFMDKLSMLFKRLIYILGFIWLCYLDHIIGSATGYIQHSLKNYTGIVIAVMILTAYKLKDFIKLPYFLWGLSFFIGRLLALGWADGRIYEIEKFESAIWNIGVYGIVLIRLLYGWIAEKKKPQINRLFFGVWLVMMFGMVLIRTDITWTRWFLLFFGCFYLTEFKEKDLNNLFCGMVEGIIIGFLVQQAYACMYRPYDMLRYEGMYSNSNINALSYLFTYAAVLCKWYEMKLKRKHVLLRIPIVALTGVLFGLTFCTMGRTALIAMVLLTVIFLGFQVLSRKRNRFKIVLIDSAAVIVAVLLCFLPTYYAIRYIPSCVDEPLYFEADMNKLDKKIQKGDPSDSEMYTDLETVLEKSFGRLFWFLKKEPSLVVQAAEWEVEFEENPAVYEEVYVESGTDKEHPILTVEEAEDPVKVRTSIYQYYWKHLKWIGQRDGVQDVWITSGYSAPHAHNIILHMAGEFGLIFGGLFLLVIFMVYHSVMFGLVERRQGAWYYRLFVTAVFTTVVAAFGMLEICWTYGQLPFTMFFWVQYTTCHKMVGVPN